MEGPPSHIFKNEQATDCNSILQIFLVQNYQVSQYQI